MSAERTKPAKVTYRLYTQLDGGVSRRVASVGDGSIITRFDRTPLPRKPTDVVCPHFLEFKWANGCDFDCAWCYLNGTFRFGGGKAPKLKPLSRIWKHLYALLLSQSEPELLNAGELSDSLLFENRSVDWTGRLNQQLDEFDGHSRHRILYVTKGTRIGKLLEINRPDRFIVSFSLNALPVAKRWEHAPSPIKRIAAAQTLAESGYEVRIRIDPIVPIRNWRQAYAKLVDIALSKIEPERITLGSLRGLQSTINNCSDTSWAKYLHESSNWGRRVEFGTRLEMFQTIIEQLLEKYGYKKVALCKETLQMWNALGLRYEKIRCNCLL